MAANLRPVLTSVPPIIDGLTAAFGLSAFAAGALTTVPVLCMGLFAPLAAVGSRRFGESATLAAAVGLIGLGAAVRAVGGVVGLFGGTAVAGAGIAVAGALVPAVVRARVPHRVGPVTGLYTSALIAGAFLAAGGTEPLRDASGLSAQAVLAVWSVPAAVALGVWLLARPAAPDAATARGGVRVRLPWGSGPAWLGAVFMGTQSLLFYGSLAWLAAVYTRLGMDAAHAGLLLAVFSATQTVTAFALPALAHRFGHRPLWTLGSVLVTTVGLFLVALVPAAAPWLWASVLGLGMGGNLALALTVVTDLAPTPRESSAYTGMAFLVGYVLAASGPIALGRLTDLTGGYRVPFLVLGVLGIATAIVGTAAARAADRH